MKRIKVWRATGWAFSYKLMLQTAQAIACCKNRKIQVIPPPTDLTLTLYLTQALALALGTAPNPSPNPSPIPSTGISPSPYTNHVSWRLRLPAPCLSADYPAEPCFEVTAKTSPRFPHSNEIKKKRLPPLGGFFLKFVDIYSSWKTWSA